MKISRQNLVILGSVVVLIGVGYAAFTQHVWEDYYITFRSSKNLAEGNGLVFNVGERLHTFTSPLGVLLPALAAWISGTQSDLVALWIYRVISLVALATGCCLIVACALRLKASLVPALLAGLWLAVDAKTLDFSTNGMETGIWVAFLAYAIWAQLGGIKHWKHMGLAWAGLMWTRPDCFIHISLLALGSLLFLGKHLGERRVAMIVCWLKAGTLTTILYLPWFLGAWAYFGSPVPHTVTAKSGLKEFPALVEQLKLVATMPFRWDDSANSMAATFLPAYYMLEGWDDGAILAGKIVGGFVGIVWLLPRVSSPVRWLSFAFFGIHAYLTLVPYFVFPWYLPAVTPFAILVLAGVSRDWFEAVNFKTPLLATRVHAALGGGAVLMSAALTWQVALQMRAQQHLIEDGVRTPMGKYIREHGARGDTVFTEPLGYVGYFSGMRTYDFPGMSSPEMVVARELVGNDWKDLIDHLQPTWVVLRPREVERIQTATEWRIAHAYERVAVFDKSPEVAQSNAPGIGYLKHDAAFWLYRRLSRNVANYPEWSAQTDFPIIFYERPWGGRIDLHAEGELYFDIPAEATTVTMEILFHARLKEDRRPNDDGIRFAVEVRDLPRGTPLQSFFINPQSEEQSISLAYALPSDRSDRSQLRISFSRRVWRDHDSFYLFVPGFETPDGTQVGIGSG